VEEKPIDPGEMTDDRLLYVLRNADKLRDWLKAVENHMLRRAMDGVPVPGHKLVQARATRKWTAAVDVVAKELSGDHRRCSRKKFLPGRADHHHRGREDRRRRRPCRGPEGSAGQGGARCQGAHGVACAARREQHTGAGSRHRSRPAANRAKAFEGIDILPAD